MIRKIKYCFAKITCKQLRLALIAFLTAITVAVCTLVGWSIHTVNIYDGEKTFILKTLSYDVTNVLSGLELKSQHYNIDKISNNGRTTLIEISYGYPVYITCGDQTVEVSFQEGTVKDALKLADITPDEFDMVYPSLNTKITKTVYIDFIDVEYVNGSYTEAVPFETETVYTSNLSKGDTKILVEGKDGLRQVDYSEKFVNGVSAEKTVVASTIVNPAVNKRVSVGTKTHTPKGTISVLNAPFDIELDSNGNPINYKSKTTVRATAYTYTGNNCSTGVAPKPGYIAVNPKVIPYGTKMYIKSPDGSIIYGYAVAADTGGFIKKYPNGVDLFMATESACRNFGVRNMEIYILG